MPALLQSGMFGNVDLGSFGWLGLVVIVAILLVVAGPPQDGPGDPPFRL